MPSNSFFLPQDIIRNKRDGDALSGTEISNFISGITDGSVTDAQISALAMAIFFNGMTDDEGAALTLSMRDSGDVINWEKYGFDATAPIVDKHSTGGVGDKVSFMLAAIVAACGAYVPMISGRGLGHTGGTMDKLEAIPGYDVLLNTEKFATITREVGCSIIGQTSNLAPADKRFYAVRDVTATVESVPLITASILSKKLAAGLNALVMDIKFGNGAFMDSVEKARVLGENIVRVANAAGVPTSALLTDMNQVLGNSVGNAVEIFETIDFLNDPENANPRLKQVTLDLAAEMLHKIDVVESFDVGFESASNALTSGAAAKKFGDMVTAHGGPSDLMDNPSTHIALAPMNKAVFSDTAGYVTSMDTRQIGQAIVAMGGGRSNPTQSIDHSVGFADFINIGDHLDTNRPICVIYGNNAQQIEMAEKIIKAAVMVGDTKPAVADITLDIIRA